MYFDERDRRNTYTLPRPPRSNISSSKDRRLTVSSINYSSSINQPPTININNETISNNPTISTHDTDSSSTQDSGYSESTSFYLVKQTKSDLSSHPMFNI